MTTLAQIKKIAKLSFIPAMKERGFSQNSKDTMAFFREGNDGIYHLIAFYILQSGINLRIHVYSWVKEMADDFDMTKFPRGTSMVIGDCLADNEIGIGCKIWRIDHLDGIPKVLDEVLIDIDSIAIPWLDGITTREELIARTSIDFRSDNEKFEKMKEKVLKR